MTGQVSLHDRTVAALAAWLNGSDHEIENHLYHAAAAALRLLNRDELGWLGVCLEAGAEASLHVPEVGEDTGDDVVTEYGQLYVGGGVLVEPPDPDGEIERVAPLARRIEAGNRHGGTMLRRRVRVLQDWEAVTEP